MNDDANKTPELIAAAALVDAAIGGKAKAGALIQIIPLHGGMIQATVKGFAPLVFNPDQDSLLNRKRAQFKGYKSSWEDVAAVSADPATGKTSPAEKYANMLAWRDYHETGSDVWSQKAARGPAPTNEGDVLLVLIRLGKAASQEQAEARVARGMVKMGLERTAFIKALAATPDIAQGLGDLRAERLRALNPLNADALLGELDEEEGEGDE